jgi:lysophospholipase L1-like esterase
MFVLLFAALKVAGQTTGYLRFDTVKIMKQNGTCELYVINKTKDSLGLLTNVGGGLTQFRRSKMLNDSTIIVGLDTLTIHGTGGTPARFALEDNSATASRSFNANGYNFAVDSFANFNLYSKVISAGVDRGVFSNLGINNTSVYLWGYHSNNVSTRSYGFIATGSLSQMFATGHAAGNTGFVQTDTSQVILESGSNWLHLYHDSTVFHNILGGNVNLRIRSLPSTVDTSYKSLVSGPNGQVFLRPGGNGGSGSGITGLTSGRVTLSTGATTIGDDAGLTYDSPTNTVTTDSVIAKRLQLNATTDFTVDTLVLFTDSYGQSVGATNAAHGFARLLSAHLQLVLKNFAISGSTMMKRTPVDPYGQVNMVDRIGDIPTKTARHKYLVFAYGLNDAGYNGANYTPANFSTDYRTVLDAALAKSWTATDIILITPWYISTDGYAGYAATTGTTQITATRHIEFVDTVIAIATQYGTKIFDIYRSQAVSGDIRLLYADAIHASNAGHAFIAGQLASYVGYSVLKNGQANATNGVTELQRLRLTTPDSSLDSYSERILSLDTNGTVRTQKINGLVRNNLSIYPDASQIYTTGKIISAKPNASTGDININGVESIVTNGVIRGNALRATGSAPTGMTGAGLELSYASGTGLIYGYDRDASTGKPLSLNFLGQPVIINGTTPSGGSDELLQVSTAGLNAKFGRFTGFMSGSGYTGAAAEIGVVSSTAVVLGYDRTGGGAGINLNLGFGLSPFVIIGSNTVTGTAPFQVNPKTYHADEVNIGNTTDQGSYTLQNTGGLYQNGAFALNLGSDANYDIYYRNSSGLFTRLAPSTDGYVLTTHSTSSAPNWEASAGRTLDAQFITQGNSGTSETDLYSYTVPANTLAADGRTVNFEIDGEVNDATATAQLKLHFAGNTTLNTGAINITAGSTAWKLTGCVMRTSSTTAHVTWELDALGLATPKFLGYSNLTSLDFTTTNIFKITAQAGGAGGGTDDITAHSWQVTYKPQP